MIESVKITSMWKQDYVHVKGEHDVKDKTLLKSWK